MGAVGLPEVAYRVVNAGSGGLVSLVREIWVNHSGALRVAGLGGILLFSFWNGMSPHWDYPYPLHIDEWFAIGFAQSTLEAGALEYPDPYGPGNVSFHPEMGFHLLLGFLKTVTGLSWMDLYRFAPGALVALLALVTYALGYRSGYGWAAALFVSLIPTSIKTLGPAFVVPVSVAMLFIPVTLLILHTMEEKHRGKSLWLLLLLIGGTIFVHPPTEVLVTALAVLYILGTVVATLAQRRYGEGFNLLLAIGVRISIPIVILGLWLPSLSKKVLEQSASAGSGTVTIGLNTQFPQAFGIMAVAISVVGLFLFITRGDGVRSYILPMVTLLLLTFLVLLFPMYQLGPLILYDRGWLYLALLVAIFAGYGVAIYFQSIPAIARIIGARLQKPVGGWIRVSLWSAGAVLLLATLTTGLFFNEAREQYPQYYHVVNDSIFADFQWIGQHITEGQQIAMGESSIAWAYPPAAGPRSTVFTAVSSPWTNRLANKLREMQESGEADIPWLRRSDISVFYTCRPRTFSCVELEDNNDLLNVRRGVYLVQGSTGAR